MEEEGRWRGREWEGHVSQGRPIALDSSRRTGKRETVRSWEDVTEGEPGSWEGTAAGSGTAQSLSEPSEQSQLSERDEWTGPAASLEPLKPSLRSQVEPEPRAAEAGEAKAPAGPAPRPLPETLPGQLTDSTWSQSQAELKQIKSMGLVVVTETLVGPREGEAGWEGGAGKEGVEEEAEVWTQHCRSEQSKEEAWEESRGGGWGAEEEAEGAGRFLSAAFVAPFLVLSVAAVVLVLGGWGLCTSSSGQGNEWDWAQGVRTWELWGSEVWAGWAGGVWGVLTLQPLCWLALLGEAAAGLGRPLPLPHAPFVWLSGALGGLSLLCGGLLGWLALGAGGTGLGSLLAELGLSSDAEVNGSWALASLGASATGLRLLLAPLAPLRPRPPTSSAPSHTSINLPPS